MEIWRLPVGATVKSHVNSHDVHLVESLGAVGTFPHAIGKAVFDTVVAEEMAACLQGRILEIFATNST